MNMTGEIAGRPCIVRGRLLALAATAILSLGAAASEVVDATLIDTFGTTAIEGSPAGVFVTDNFVFVLERFSHRIAVHSRATGANLFYYGALKAGAAGVAYTDSAAARTGNNAWIRSTGDGGFTQPRGLALDTFSGASRFAVADTGNNRVQLFEFDPASGAITFLSAYGGGAGEESFYEPRAVAFMAGGDLLVADTGNKRVVRLGYGGGNWSFVEAYQFASLDVINGLCYDETANGFWVANYGVTGKRRRISFHHVGAGFSDEPVVALGLPDNTFANPADIQIWNDGTQTYVVTADCGGSRIGVRLFRPVGGAGGDYSRLVDVGAIAYSGDDDPEGERFVRQPEGVFPLQGTNLIYVADTGNKKVKWFGLAIEEVEDQEVVGPPVPWDISSFTVAADGATASVGWQIPSATDGRPPTGEDFSFRLDFRPSLTTGEWVTNAIPPFAVDQSEAGALHTESGIDLSSSPASGFFRLWWLNKVDE